jgi:hypothetical protein
MAANDIILKVSLDGAQEELNNLVLLQDAVNQLSKQKKELNEEQKKLTKAVQDGTISSQEAEQAAIELAAEQVELNLTIKETKNEFRDAERAVINNSKANKANEGSIAQMRAELANAQKAYTLLSKEERENDEIGGKLQKTIKAQSDELKELEEEIGITSRSVGDYGKALQGALPLMGGFGGQIQNVIGQLGQIRTALGGFVTAQKGASAATTGTSKALRVMKVALISTGVGAFVVVLGSLVAAFLSTQRGIDAVTRTLEPLKELFQTFIGFVQNQSFKVLDRLKKAIDNPKQAFIDLGNAIIENFVNRFKGAVGVVKSIASLYINTFKVLALGIKQAIADVPLIGAGIDQEQLKKDLDAAKEQVIKSTQELADQSLQAVTGVENVAQKVADSYNNATEAGKEAVARGREIADLTIEISQAQITLNNELEKANLEFNKQKSIAEDTNKTAQERLEAAAKAQEALENATKLEQDQLNRQIKLAELKTEANDTDREAQQEIQDLIGERNRVEADAVQRGLELRNKVNTIAQQEEAKRKKAIEDNEKKQIDSQNKILDNQIKNLELLRKLEASKGEETDEQKFQRDKDLQDKIGELRLKKAEQNGQDVTQVKLENEIKENEILTEERKRQEEAAAEEKAAKEEEEKVLAEQKEAEKKARIDAGIQAVDTLQQAAFDNQNRRIDEQLNRDIEALNLKREAGEISEEEFNQKRLELDKKAFSDRKRLSQAQNIIDFAVGVGKTLATYGATPAAIAPLALLAVQKGTQAAAIAAQKFAKGGLLKGASHENGGIPISVAGSGMVEAEGGEAIINKKSTAKHLGLLSAINQSEGGAPLARRGLRLPSVGSLQRFQNGGITPVTGGGIGTDFSGLETSIINGVAESIGEIKVTNVASETTGVANRVQQIQDSASF